MLEITVGTFNLNNLFSRFNFKAELTDSNQKEVNSEIQYVFTKDEQCRLRTYGGKLVNKKSDVEQKRVAERILKMNLDILAVQEVEDIDTLRAFNSDQLGGSYSDDVLIEGNDKRLIDIGLLSKYPIGRVTSWQYAVHPSLPNEKVFSRDLLQVDIESKDRSERLFTLFVNHLKSQFINYWENKDKATKANDAHRLRQSDVVAQIVKERMKEDNNFMVLGDMNAGLDSPTLAPFTENDALQLQNGLENVSEDQPLKIRDDPPASVAWTHRFKESGSPAKYELFDQIWLTKELDAKLKSAWINRRSKLTKDGSDHDPSWVVLSL